MQFYNVVAAKLTNGQVECDQFIISDAAISKAQSARTNADDFKSLQQEYAQTALAANLLSTICKSDMPDFNGVISNQQYAGAVSSSHLYLFGTKQHDELKAILKIN